MKTKIIKLGDGCNLTVTIIDRQGMPLKLATLKSLVISLVSDRSQNLSFTANRDNTLTIALTYASNLTKTGMYQIRVEGELSDGQAFDYTEQIIEVKDLPESTETTFITSLVLRDVHNVTEKEIQDVNYKKLGYEAFSPFKAYTTADVVVFGGSLYKFTANKSAGIWNADNVEETSFAELIGQGGTSFEDLGYEPFSETEDYAIDDVVIYEGALYKFTADHSAGAWVLSHVVPTSVEELIKSGEYPNLTSGDITPKTNAPVASTIKMAMTTTGGDMDIKNGMARIKAIRGNLVKVGDNYLYANASKFVSTGMNLVDPEQYYTIGSKKHYYFPIQRAAWGEEGTTQENNGYVVVFGGSCEVKYSDIKPTSSTTLQAVETHTDSKGVVHYLPDSDGWLVIATEDSGMPACHITWSGYNDTVAGAFGNSVIDLPPINATFDSMIGIIDGGRSSFDEINFVVQKRYKRNRWGAFQTVLDWTMTTETSGEGEEAIPIYVFSHTFSDMMPNGLFKTAFEGFIVNGKAIEYRSSTVDDVVEFYALISSYHFYYQLETEIVEDINVNGEFVANDFGLTYFMTGDENIAPYSMFVDFEFSQGGKDQLFNAVTYQKTLAEVIATALCDLDRRFHALEGNRETIECTNLIVNRSALIANGMTAVAAAPASATSKGNTGDFFVNTTHFYICVAPNTWRRVEISTF